MTVQEVVCKIMVSAFFSTVVVQMQVSGLREIDAQKSGNDLNKVINASETPD